MMSMWSAPSDRDYSDAIYAEEPEPEDPEEPEDDLRNLRRGILEAAYCTPEEIEAYEKTFGDVA